MQNGASTWVWILGLLWTPNSPAYSSFILFHYPCIYRTMDSGSYPQVTAKETQEVKQTAWKWVDFGCEMSMFQANLSSPWQMMVTLPVLSWWQETYPDQCTQLLINPPLSIEVSWKNILYLSRENLHKLLISFTLISLFQTSMGNQHSWGKPKVHR